MLSGPFNLANISKSLSECGMTLGGIAGSITRTPEF
jgi:hypothetical protein